MAKASPTPYCPPAGWPTALPMAKNTMLRFHSTNTPRRLAHSTRAGAFFLGLPRCLCSSSSPTRYSACSRPHTTKGRVLPCQKPDTKNTQNTQNSGENRLIFCPMRGSFEASAHTSGLNR